MIRTIAMILFTLAVMAAVQTRVETRMGPMHAGVADANYDLHMGLRS